MAAYSARYLVTKTPMPTALHIGLLDQSVWTNAHGYGTTAARPAASSTNVGYLYYNTTLLQLQRSTGTDWVTLVAWAGSTPALDLVCDSTPISGHKLVTVNDQGLAVVADNTNLTHVGRPMGLTLGAVSAGQSFQAPYSGTVTEPSWTWTIGDTLYLGTNGTIVPYSGIGTPLWEIAIGTAVAPTKIALNITTTSITRT